jgi:ribonuclease P protein component
MLPAANRMRRSADFVLTLRRGRRCARGPVAVSVVLSSDVEPPLVGFVVGRMVGGAVVRNLVRRRLRAVVAGRLAELPAGARVVVRALPGAGRTDFGELSSSVAAALAKAAS